MKLIIVTIFCISLINSAKQTCIRNKSSCFSAESMNDYRGTGEKQKDNMYIGCHTIEHDINRGLVDKCRKWKHTHFEVQFKLYSRSLPKGRIIKLTPSKRSFYSDFNYKLPTAFIIHGFQSSGKEKWVIDMKNAYTFKVDANVVVVDWKKGADLSNYLRAVANTRIVGAALASLIKNYRLNTASVHLIGHSLGAHVAAFAAKQTRRTGRITALDPAQPCFEDALKRDRLAKGDAKFIDVIHTDAEPFLPYLGLGMIHPIGDVDFYFNDGYTQPGCGVFTKGPLPGWGPQDIIREKVKELIEYLKKMPRKLVKTLTCSHSRAHEYFRASLQSHCTFQGIKVKFDRDCLFRGLFDKPKGGCESNPCIPLGLDTPKHQARGSFAVYTTKKNYPFCKNRN